MRRGDISCNLAPIIAFNLDVLVQRKTDSLIDKLLKKQEVNRILVKSINLLWDKYNYRIFIMSLEHNEDYLIKLLGNYQLNYSRFEKLTFDELEWKCRNEFTYYYSSDYNEISRLNSRCAKHIDELNL